MKPILEINNISKRYTVGTDVQPYLNIRDVITNLFKGKLKKDNKQFWALDDVSFKVYPGESIGIIGRNGAGKSTLLKVLSRITPPTKGFIKARGRVASLLEVGTGFHPELTGRENVYLNGSILGLSRVEINRKFDEIVEFSGVEKFLDTPLKHYSSGMQLRLAFAVAANLEPEILVIDEVLAVGDAAFQKKCLDKMREVSQSGRTILFVSHNIAAVRKLCTKGVYLIKGKVNKWGNIEDVTNEYVYSRENSISDGLFEIQKVENRQGNGMIQFHSLEFTNQLDERTSIINMGDELSIKLSIRVNDLKVRDNYRIGIQINDSEERPISLLINEDDGFKIKLSTTNYFKIIIKNIKLYPGRYYVSLLAACKHSTDVYDILSNIAYFDVENNGQYTNRPLTKNSGVIFLNAKWSKI